MPKISLPLYGLLVCLTFALTNDSFAQNVGIGTTSPDYTLHVASAASDLLKLENTTTLNTGVMSEMFFKTGLHYTGAIKTIGTGTAYARLGLFTYASTNSGSLLERMSILDNGYVGIGTNNPLYQLDVNGRMRVRNGNGSAGIYFMDAANANNRGFIGMQDDNILGLYGSNGAGWALKMNVTSGSVDFSGDVSVFSPFYVSASGFYAGSFTNYSGDDSPAVLGVADNVAGMGVGIRGEGGETGVYALANLGGGSNHRYGIEAKGQNGPANNYGVYASAFGGNNATAVYGTASGGTVNWGAYFSGSVYTTGSYQGSDRKLKANIQPLEHAVDLIEALKPPTYVYNTEDYKQMMLPEGQQYGLIADEVKQVFPSLVKTAIQPAAYENDDRKNGKMISDEITFEAVNYTALVPVLIAAMQEQQATIEAQQKRIEALEAKLRD